MKKFNDFDLDVKNIEGVSGPQAATPATISLATKILSFLTPSAAVSILEGCSGNCLTNKCTEGCVPTEYTDECTSI